MFHALDRRQLIGERPELRGRSHEHQNFKAIVMVKMHMHGRDNGFMGFMLQFRKLLGQVASVVVKDKGQRGRRGLGFVFPLLPDQFLADQIANRFGTAGVSPFRAQRVEFFQ